MVGTRHQEGLTPGWSGYSIQEDPQYNEDRVKYSQVGYEGINPSVAHPTELRVPASQDIEQIAHG